MMSVNHQNHPGGEAITIVMTGGGSGGHITPISSVAAEIKKHHSSTRIVYIGQKGDPIAKRLSADIAIDHEVEIFAGKFRRYHGTSFWSQLKDIRTQLLNIRDFFLLILGSIQATYLLLRLRPKAIFVKGGFVSVPVVFASRITRTPYVTHDSDVHPGLANRIASRWASWHATGMPARFYPYNPETTVYTGVPVDSNFSLVTPALLKKSKQELGLNGNEKVVLVTGGGLGAQRLNDMILSIALELLSTHNGLHLFHITGIKNVNKVEAAYRATLTSKLLSNIHVIDFTNKLYQYSAAADLVITRAGATALAEFAIQGKACLVVPNPYLSGGHQLKNANHLKEQGSIEVLPESSSREELLAAVSGVINDNQRRHQLGDSLRRLAKPEAAEQISKLILSVAKKR